jgi:signal peptidase I
MANKKSHPPRPKRDSAHFDPEINPHYSHVPSEPEQPSRSERIGHVLWEIGKTVGTIALVALIIRIFLVQPFFVQGESMEPNFHDGDYLLVNQLSYKLGAPSRGDVIIFKAPPEPDTDYIKRIIGLPGETVDLKDGHFFITNQRHSTPVEVVESYEPAGTLTMSSNQQTHWELGTDQYFVAGDNRGPGKSLDSRAWGPLPKQNIIGRAWFRAYPLAALGFISKPKYPGLSLAPQSPRAYAGAGARALTFQPA